MLRGFEHSSHVCYQGGLTSSERPPPLRTALIVLGLLAALAAGSVVLAKRSTPTVPVVPSASVSASTSASDVSPASATPSASVAPRPVLIDETASTMAAQREALFKNMQAQLDLSDDVIEKTKAIFAPSKWLGQGNPKVTQHPMSRKECLEIREQNKFRTGDSRCGAPNMVAVFDPAAGQTVESAKLCVDQYEYPNIPCEYPVTWVRSDEAQNLCKAQGKRICDAHEWEGSCAGALKTPEQEYTFGERRIMQEYLHNKSRELVWAYGTTRNHKLCATGSRKSPGCVAPTWEKCGSNTYPAGAFPECVSSFGVYDQHGNAAEHMNLPLTAEELGSRGGTGENEMKGSWFMFQIANLHDDDCHWRALSWHAGKLMEKEAHRNYHLGFRCCKDIE